MCGDELLDGSRGCEAEEGEVMGVTEGGGGLSAFVGQRKCLMLYADELTLAPFLGKMHSELCQSPPPLTQTRIPRIRRLLSPCLYSPRPLGTPIKQVCDKSHIHSQKCQLGQSTSAPCPLIPASPSPSLSPQSTVSPPALPFTPVTSCNWVQIM